MARSVTVFRSRLRDDVPDEYWELATELAELARSMDGFVEYKVFVADDGERLSLAVFESPEAEAAWRDHDAHRAAQRRGRERLYRGYDVAVCELQQQRSWSAEPS
jgi:heme-degrading monooxygenase HmoA